jgi:hypothetical protein
MELIGLLNELLEAERAGARLLAGHLREAGDGRRPARSTARGSPFPTGECASTSSAAASAG